jgi:sec-independent protein translocase protein TatA
MNAWIIAGIVGPWQIVIVVALALLFFGGKKIPELMKGLGQGMKEFKKATREVNEPEEEAKDPDKLKG